MTREQLEHAIRTACDVTGDTELWIFGSQAILGEFPNASESLRSSIEVDVQPKNNPDWPLVLSFAQAVIKRKEIAIKCKIVPVFMRGLIWLLVINI